MKPIHTETYKEEKGWRETTTYTSYYYDEETGDVTEVVTVNSDNPYPNGRDMENEEVSRKILSENEIPTVVRKKVEELL